MRIYLVGFMGSGKSTFGQALANELGFGFTDVDLNIEEAAGQSIAAIFEEKGEAYFRKLESEELLKTALLTNHVIATGGGAPCFNHQIEWMNDNGTTVYLKLFEPEITRRLSAEMTTRPLLKNLTEADLPEFVYKTLRERAFYYHKAQIVIDALNMTPEILAKILNKEIVAEEQGEL